MCEDLVVLFVVFECEDVCVGLFVGGLGGAVAYVLRIVLGEVVGYMLMYENCVLEWDCVCVVVFFL